MSEPSISKTGGAVLLGGLFASVLSGVLLIQTVLYFKFYPRDSKRSKSLVGVVWFIDIIHTVFVWCAIWDYLVTNFGREDYIDHISWSIPLTIASTAVMTVLVQCFYAHRIFLLSKKAWLLPVSVLILTFLRLLAASVTATEMIHFKSFSQFRHHFYWAFTAGLALSVSIDFLITCSLSILLHSCRTGGEQSNRIIDALILYVFETGCMTFIATIVALICWVVVPTNLIFLGLHFVIAKLYANSLLVTLNTRLTIHRNRPSFEVYNPDGSEPHDPSFLFLSQRRDQTVDDGQKDTGTYFGDGTNKKLQINVESTVHCRVESDSDIFDKEC